MDRSKFVEMLVPRVPPELKAAIRADAERRGTSESDVAVEILAREFGIEFEATARPGNQRRKNPTMLYLSMPPRLRVAIQRRAASHGVASRYTVVARSVLLAHYQQSEDAAA